MKTLYSIIFFGSALASLASSGPPPPVGPADVAVHGFGQNLVYQETKVRTNSVGANTNFVIASRSTTTNFTVNSAALMALIGNSFNTNFPAGCRLLLESLNPPFYTFAVSDTTGTNVGFIPVNVLTTSFLSGTAIVFSGNKSQDAMNDISDILAAKDNESYTTALSFTYDDSAMTTADGSHTTFTWVGLVHNKSSESGDTVLTLYNENVTIDIIGSGSYRGQPSAVFTGSIRAKVVGSQ